MVTLQRMNWRLMPSECFTNPNFKSAGFVHAAPHGHHRMESFHLLVNGASYMACPSLPRLQTFQRKQDIKMMLLVSGLPQHKSIESGCPTHSVGNPSHGADSIVAILFSPAHMHS